MKILKQRIAKAFGGGTSERGTSNLEIVVWISVVLVIAVGLFFLRDNIAKFINNAATQIAGEESRPEGMNEYGFYFEKIYYNESTGIKMVFHEDGSNDYYFYDYGLLTSTEPGSFTYSEGAIINNGTGTSVHFSSDGKTLYDNTGNFVLQE